MREWMQALTGRSMRDFILHLKQNDLSMAQYGTLMQLAHQGHCAVTVVGSHLGITNAAASQLVDKLVQMGLVARAEAEHDRRVKQLTLTEKGQTVVKLTHEARFGWLQSLAEAVPAEQRAEAARLLRELAQLAQTLDAPHPVEGRER
jgi:DNA-binding MarR family transcriptional regulator